MCSYSEFLYYVIIAVVILYTDMFQKEYLAHGERIMTYSENI